MFLVLDLLIACYAAEVSDIIHLHWRRTQNMRKPAEAFQCFIGMNGTIFDHGVHILHIYGAERG